MKIFAVADLHLSFNENIDKPMNKFGPGWEDHPESLKASWEKLVTDDDIVLVPGDISWALRIEEAIADFDWIHALPGKKLLSKGNHDLWWSRIQYLNSLYDDIIFLQNECYVVESENIVITASRGWPYPGSDEYTEHDEKIYARELGRMKLGLDAAKKEAPGHLHGMPAYNTGIRGNFKGIEYILASYDFIGGAPKVIYDSNNQ